MPRLPNARWTASHSGVSGCTSQDVVHVMRPLVEALHGQYISLVVSMVSCCQMQGVADRA